MTSIAILLVSACGGAPTPAGGTPGAGLTPPAGSPAAASEAAPAATGPGGVPLVEFADTDDPTAAAHQELELVHEMRDEAGMPARLGANGAAAFTALDGVEAAYGRTILDDVAASIASGAIPHRIAGDPPVGQLASLDGEPGPARGAPGAIDVSLFADTGFTANAIMSLYTGLIERAAESNNGTLPKQEHHTEKGDGLRQEVDLNTTMRIMTGGGRVTADITMSATDNIFDLTTGSFIALYTSTSTGHFDVDACPDRDGIAAGTYTFETKHELNDVSGAANTQSGAGRSVGSPFKLVDGDDAHLQRIEATMNLGADARGPGTAGGPGPTGPFDWGASQQLQLVMPPRGGTFGTGPAATITGSGGEQASGSLFISAAMAQMFLGEVGKEAEKFWRSGKCIELKPSDDTRKVQPNEKIDLTVEAKHKFTGDDVKSPIVAKFTGTKSLDPHDQPIDPPAKFTFKAGPNKDDKGTIDLTQTSKRGIGMRQIVFTVGLEPLQAKIDSTLHQDAAGNVYDTQIHLKPLDLTPAEDGTSKGHGTVTWTTTYTPPTADCKPKTYTGSFETDVTATPDPDDPTKVKVTATFVPGVLKPEIFVCKGKSFPFTGGTSLGIWTALARPQTVVLDQPTAIPVTTPFGTARMTVTIKKKPPA